MKRALLQLIACVHCQAPLRILSVANEESPEIISGSLECTECKAVSPIQDGIPAFLDKADYESHVAESFGFEWQMHHDRGFEQNKVFGRTLDDDITYFLDAFGLQASEMQNLLILDAGCGSGTLTAELARRFPTCVVIGVDFNPSIREILSKHRQLPNLHIVRSSVLKMPFGAECFDLVWSHGVIHHTGDTRTAFGEIVRTVKKGGKAYLWVYERKISLLVGLRKALMPLGLVEWNHRFLYHFCRLISVPTWLGVKLISLVGRISLSQKHTHLRILTRNRGYQELVMTWFDVLSPKYRDTYTQAEFESWFVQSGFEQLRQYWWPVGVCGVRKAAET